MPSSFDTGCQILLANEADRREPIVRRTPGYYFMRAGASMTHVFLREADSARGREAKRQQPNPAAREGKR